MADSLIITSNFKGFERNLTPSNLVCQCNRTAPHLSPVAGQDKYNKWIVF
jgi:hypothetical protein